TSFSDLNRVETTYQTTMAAFVQNENSLALIPFRRNQILARKENNKASLDISNLDVTRMKIHSPVQGRILKRHAFIGEYVKKGQKLLEIYDPSFLEIKVPLSQNELAWIIPEFFQAFAKAKDFQNIQTKSCEVVIQLLNSQDTCFWKGKIVRLASEIETATRTLSTIVQVEKEKSDDFSHPPLLKGAFVRLKFKAFILKDVYKIPRNLITNDNHVALFDHGKLSVRPIEILRIYQDFAYINKGLKPSDKLITSLLPQIVDGMPVAISEKNFSDLQEKKNP
ncbi:MAG: HlyD family efflux transporter periplasmic adaptor subunit, partial [Candidatus Brocadiae bacterium]|nr:HlyD family efflux transporter periplasmic adaptor subunit [Candidatus Brocadiia bacterium]